MKIGPVVSEIGGRLILAPQWGALYIDQPQRGAGKNVEAQQVVARFCPNPFASVQPDPNVILDESEARLSEFQLAHLVGTTLAHFAPIDLESGNLVLRWGSTVYCSWQY